MSFDILYASFGNNSDCIDGHIGIYNDAYKYVFKKNDNKASGVIYYNKDLYSDLDLITLNGSLTSKNGLKPIYYSYGDSSFKLDKTKIFKLDNKKHEDDHYFTNKHVYGSYNDLVGLDGSTKSILAYDLNFKNEGFISFRFKIDKSKELDADALRTLLCIQKGYGEGEKVLIEIKDNDKVITINYRGLISPINTNITILPDVWHTFSFTWNQLGYKIYVDNQTPFERTGSSLFDFTDSLTFIGCNNVSNQPCNQLNGMIEMFAYGYNYDTNKHNLLKDAKPINHITSYDELERPITKTIETKSIKYNHQYEYYDELVNENNEEYIKVNTKPCVETLEDGTKIIYSYDLIGNVTKQIFIKNNVIIKSLSYKYDALSRLIEEKCFINNNYDYHIEYVYDNNGNILYKTELDSNGEVEYQLEYVYSNAIKDQLTQIRVYGREEILLDTININYSNTDPFRPSSYKNNNLTWQGRRLLSYGNNTYTYNSEGIRISKTTSSGTYNYILDDNRIIKEIKPNNINVYYHYDEKGMLVGFNYNNNEYFYVRDILGNIIKIIDENNNIKVEYKYNAFGEVLSITGDNTLKSVNSYLYKGYYYDFETELYYCNSRYYDSDICRWISIDEISYLDRDDINGINLWCYCGNNPVMFVDYNGRFSWIVFALVGAIIVLLSGCSHPSDNGYNYAVDEKSKEEGKINYSISSVTVNDVTAPSIKIYDSYTIKSDAEKRTILEYIINSEAGQEAELSIDDIDYYIREWSFHNFAYNNPDLAAKYKGVSVESIIESTKDVDLNTNDASADLYNKLGRLINVLY